MDWGFVFVVAFGSFVLGMMFYSCLLEWGTRKGWTIYKLRDPK